MTKHTLRIAIVQASAERIAPYLPANYSIVGELEADDALETPWLREGILRSPHTVIAGVDVAGWTLDDYVIPRLASGLWAATEFVAKGGES